MKKLSITIFALIILLSFTAHSATAQNSFGIKGGLFNPVGDASDYDAGPSIEASYTYMFTENMGVEASLGYYMIDYKAAGFKSEASAIPVLATFKYVHPITDTMNIYGGAGVGIHFLSVKVTYEGHSASDSDSEFGFHALGGLDYLLSDNMTIGGEIRYSSADDLDGITASLTFRFFM